MPRERSLSRPNRLALPSLLGDGVPERLRSTSIALVGIVAAVGLSMVAFILQLGLPSVVGAPLPEPPPKRPAVVERNRVEQKAAAKASAQPTAVPDGSSAGSARGIPPRDSSPAALPVREPNEGAVLVTGTPPARSQPQPTSPPRPDPVPSPSAEPPPPAPLPVEPDASASEVPPLPPEAPPAPAPTHPGNGNAYGKGNGNGLGNGGEPPGQVAKAASKSEPSE